MRLNRLQGMQRPDRRRRLPFGARLQPLAEQHQRDHHSGSFEVKVRHSCGRGAEPEPDRQTPAGRSTECHQQVHVARARLQGLPAGLVKACAQHKLHRRGQRKLQPCRQHPVPAQQIGQHRNHQRRRQQQAQRHRRKASPRRGAAAVRRRSRFTRAIAGIAHRAPQGRFHVHARLVADAGRLGGQVHRHIAHARHFFQRPLDPHHARRASHTVDAQIQT